MLVIPKGERSFSLLLSFLRKGDPVILACDTIYGFVGRAPQAESALQKLKGRGQNKPFLWLLADPLDLSRYSSFPLPSKIRALWPGAYTFVLPVREGGTRAFRVPEDDRLRRLIRQAGAPLFSTSVNRTGTPPLFNPDDMIREFRGELPLLERDRDQGGQEPSTVLDLTVSPPRVLRQGAGKFPF